MAKMTDSEVQKAMQTLRDYWLAGTTPEEILKYHNISNLGHQDSRLLHTLYLEMDINFLSRCIQTGVSPTGE